MKRDIELVRELLLQINDDRELNGKRFKEIDVKDRDHDEVAYVLTLLITAGFVTGNTTMDMPLVSGLSWDGHELLNNIRDPNVWERTKEAVKPLASVSIAMLGEIAKVEIKRLLGLP